jgi:glycosyltransferase involved in cell wall biosynthesis
MSNRVLYVSHNHPNVRPGGAEGYALALHRAIRSAPNWESIFLARSGPPLTSVARYHDGTHLTLVDGRSDEYYFHTEFAHFDSFLGCTADKHLWTHYLRDFLRAFRPDVVHFQHTLYLGYDMIREVRNTLPDAAILYTLHDFTPICQHHGQMVRSINNDELCTYSSPRRCHECFPDYSPQAFFMRKRFVQAMFELVDLFIAPSQFLRQRYVDWGIPPERIKFQENGCAVDAPESSADGDDERPRDRLGFFGQLTRFKGFHILLDAMRLLVADGVDVHLWVHGANLDLQTPEFRKQVTDLLAACKENVTLVGRYEHDELPALMANIDWVVVPSIWWENSPLVIQEAFLNGRPIICADIGGMAEKVANGVNGLHFRARDPISLAQTLRRATTTPELWHSLRKGIPQVHRMEDHVGVLSRLYTDLIEQKRRSADAAVVRLL